MELDLIARRYGVLPAEFLELDAAKYQFNLLVASVGSEAESKLQLKGKVNGK